MSNTQSTEMVGGPFVTVPSLKMSGETPSLSSQYMQTDAAMMNTGQKAATLGVALFGGAGEDFPVKGANGK